MKRIKSILSFVLIFFLSISFLPPTGVYAIPGGSYLETPPFRFNLSTGAGKGDTGVLFYFRMGVIPIEHQDGTADIESSHITWHRNGTVSLRKVAGAVPPGNWFYFNTNNITTRYALLNNGKIGSVLVHGWETTTMPGKPLKKFMDLLGFKSYGGTDNWDVWHEKVKALTIPQSKKIAKHLLDDRYDDNKDYYFVFERLKVYRMKAGGNGSETFLMVSYQDYKYGNKSKTYMDRLSGQANIYASTYGFINQSADAPFGKGWYNKNSNGKYGYAVYAGTVSPDKQQKTTLNITVEYQGKVGQEKGTIHTRSSFIKNDSEYWKVTGDTFKLAHNYEILLRLFEHDKANKVKIRKPYTILAGRVVKLTLSKGQTFTGMLKELEASFNNSSVKWKPEPLTGKNAVGVKVVPKHFITDFQSYLNSKHGILANQEKFNRSDILNGILKSSGDFDRFVAPKLSTPDPLYRQLLFFMLGRLSTEASSPDGIVNSKGNGIVAGKPLGVSISYLVKAKPVISCKMTVNIHIDKNNKSKIGEPKRSNNKVYTNLDQENIPISPKAKVVFAVPYETLDQSEVKSTLSNLSSEDLKNPDKIIDSLSEVYKKIELQEKGGIDVVTLGCDPDTIRGYTVYEILINAETPTGGVDPASGKVELPAYMLNRYFPNIINTSSDGKVQYQVGKDFTVKKELYKDQETCPRCGSTFFPITQPRRHQDWNIEWRDQSSSGYHIALDNKSRDRYFPSMPNGVWGSAKRSTLASWTSQNTESWSDPSGKIIDYGFNLIRASVKDNKALSGIAYKTYDVVDKDNVLQFKPYFGVSPVSNPLRASSLRSSMALAGKVSDTITVASRYTRYHGSGFDEKLNHHFEPEIGHTECGKYSCWWVVDEPEVNIYWYTFPAKTASGIRINGSSANSFTYTFDSNVRKYQTATMDTGENEKISRGSTAVNIHAFSPNAGEVADGNEYRFANVRYNGVTHNFYPEVNMVYKIDGTQYDGNSPYRIASTMGEVLRKSKSSSLYLFKLNGVGQTTTGVTYSDSALGGTVSRGSKHVVIPAGADVHIKAEPKNITLDLYGYALDSINADTDSTFKPEKFTSHRYTDIVASGRNVDTEWNGRANRPALIKHFSDWADNILDIRNFSADFELHVNGIKKASNFSAVVGDIKRNKSITEDGVYQLQFKKGSLLSNRDYSLLIKQIASDYQCSEAEADAVFKASGIYTSILNAIESSTSDINNSGKAQLGSADWTDDLGSNGNWYDEYVNTFVVRRFTNKGNKINSITATDKIDYGLAPDGSERRLQNANYNRVNRAFWKLSIFFNPARAKEVKDLLVDRGSFYDPSKRWSKLSEARDSFTVLMHGVRVQRADFGISADSTKDF